MKLQIKSIIGKLLFELEKENNTIKDTLLEAIKQGVNLRDADLRNAYLVGADLQGVNFRAADIRYANLRGADLRNADLRYTDLRSANLRYTKFEGADLEGADLEGAKNKDLAYLPIFCKWSFSTKGDKIRIGCKEKTIEEWDEFFASNKEYETPRDTEEFKQIQAVYSALKSYLEILNK